LFRTYRVFQRFQKYPQQLAPDFEGLATFIFSCGIAFATVAFVADSIQAGSLWAAKSKPVDPTAVGYGAEGALLIYGPINRLLNVCILFAATMLIFKTRLFPRWTAWLGLG
jgi:hypothetical protein